MCLIMKLLMQKLWIIIYMYFLFNMSEIWLQEFFTRVSKSCRLCSSQRNDELIQTYISILTNNLHLICIKMWNSLSRSLSKGRTLIYFFSCKCMLPLLMFCGLSTHWMTYKHLCETMYTMCIHVGFSHSLCKQSFILALLHVYSSQQ